MKNKYLLESEIEVKRLKARVVVLGDYGVVTPLQEISFDDKCPICGADELEVIGNNYCSDGEWYWTENIYCKNKCKFKYGDLLNLVGLKR